MRKQQQLLFILLFVLLLAQAQEQLANKESNTGLQSLFKSIKSSVQSTVEKLQKHDLVRKAQEKVKSWFKNQSKPFANTIVKDVSKTRAFPVQLFSSGSNKYKLEIVIPNRNKDAYKVKKIGKQNVQQVAVQLLPRERATATPNEKNNFLRGKEEDVNNKDTNLWTLVLDEYDNQAVLERTFEFSKVIQSVDATYKDGTLQVIVHLSNKNAAQEVQIDFVPIN